MLGAAGGVGLAAMDVARSLGGKVLAAASTDEKLQLCIERGAHGVVNYSTEDLKQRVRELTDGGADVAVDPVGGEQSEPALRSLRNGGRLLVVGFASGSIAELPANQILLRNRSVLGVDWGAWAMSDPAANADPHGRGAGPGRRRLVVAGRTEQLPAGRRRCRPAGAARTAGDRQGVPDALR